jgi:ribonuclease Z
LAKAEALRYVHEARIRMTRRLGYRLLALSVSALALGAGPAPRTRIVLLGTGTPNATPDRQGPATAIVVGDTPYLIDAGTGVVRRAAAAAEEKGVTALRASNQDRLFVTHLHSDHTLGYPDLILTPWVLDRDVPLEAYGPPGLAAMTTHILEAYKEDIDIRLHGGEPINAEGYKVHVHEVTPGVVYKDANVTVEAFAVPHGAWPHAYGYKFTTPDGVIVVSGDTGPFDGMVDVAKGADVLIHEVYSTDGWKKRDAAWQKYHAAYHTPGWKVGEIASKAGVPTLILTHELLWSATKAQLLAEVRSRYKGRLIYGDDLDVFDLAALKKK